MPSLIRETSVGLLLRHDRLRKALPLLFVLWAGTGLPAHWHSYPEYTVILAGKGTLVLDGKKHDVSPGSYLVIPAKMVHEFTCAPGVDCLLLIRRGGPTDYNFVKP